MLYTVMNEVPLHSKIECRSEVVVATNKSTSSFLDCRHQCPHSFTPEGLLPLSTRPLSPGTPFVRLFCLGGPKKGDEVGGEEHRQWAFDLVRQGCSQEGPHLQGPPSFLGLRTTPRSGPRPTPTSVDTSLPTPGPGTTSPRGNRTQGGKEGRRPPRPSFTIPDAPKGSVYPDDSPPQHSRLPLVSTP